MVGTLYQELNLDLDIQNIRDIMHEQINQSTAFIREALGGMIENSGKMLRPALLMLSSRFGDETDTKEKDRDSRKLHVLAAAVELLHLATLIHDDIIDQAPSRRGIPTIHTRYGNRNAVLIGDFLFTRSFKLAADYTDMETGKYIAAVISSICESEIRQHELLSPSSTTFKEYHRRIMGKTAALFAVSAYVGAYQNGVDDRNCRRLRKIGTNIGTGFQIIDDILDFSVRSEQTGKLPGTDIRQGIPNLPLILALRNDSGVLERKLSGRPRNGRRLKHVLALTENLGGIEQARRFAHLYTEKALQSVGLLPDSIHRDRLEHFVSSLLKREY